MGAPVAELGIATLQPCDVARLGKHKLKGGVSRETNEAVDGL